MATRPMAVKLDPETRERLTRLAAVKKRSPHWLVKEAVREYTEREELLEKLRQESLYRWESYEISEESTSNEAVVAWLDTWGRSDSLIFTT